VWNSTVSRAPFMDSSSRLVAAKAATQGMYRMVKARKEMELRGVKMVPNAADSWASVAAPVRTVRVLTTVSLAETPVMMAVEARQSEKPRGAKMGAMIDPRPARILLLESLTRLNCQSKLCRNQMTME